MSAKKPLMAVYLCLSLFVFAAALAARTGEEGRLRVLTPTVRQYEKAVISLAPDRVPDNAFNPNEASLDALITLPSGKIIKVPGFWFQRYRRTSPNPKSQANEGSEILEKAGSPEWRVHFSSKEPGRHRIALELRDAGGMHRTDEQTFEVTPGTGSGFVRISPRNRQYLEYESGKPFFPLGFNLCMYPKKEGTFYFSRLLEKLHAAGGNYVRIWQEYYVPKDLGVVARAGEGDFTGFPLETQATGLGRYDLESASRLDKVADIAQNLDVYWQLTFEMTVWWQRRMAYRWNRNPYNSENGGPCVLPSDYFTNPVAKELVRRKLRYSVARWGWTSHLVAWELWNEVDNNEDFNSEACAGWHREMGDYLRSVDPWQHLITTSWRDRNTFALPQIDIVQGHSYFGPEYDAAQYSLQDSDHLMQGFNKPFFFGEQGIEGPVSVDPEGKHLHDTLWATALSGAAGTGLYWWWHNYIDPYNLLHHYSAVAKFVSGIDWPARRWNRVGISRPNLPVTLNVYGLAADDRALIWIHDPLAFRIMNGKALRGSDQKAASCNVLGLGDGQYELEWYDTSSGQILRCDRASVNHLTHFGYGIELKPPEFWGDIAVRVIRQGTKW